MTRFPIKSGMTILGLFILTACSAVLPDRTQDLSDFVPQEKELIESDLRQGFDGQAFTFVSDNYPDDCAWTTLERVVDGDTIVVSGNERVRFIGIDTPEDKDPRKPIQPFALQAADTLKDLLETSEKICLISDSVGDKIDKYGRTLAYIFTSDGKDINAELLHLGMAKGYFYFPFERKEEFRIYEREAKNAKVGRWE